MKIKELVSILVPVYNIENAIEKNINILIDKVSPFLMNFEIIITIICGVVSSIGLILICKYIDKENDDMTIKNNGIYILLVISQIFVFAYSWINSVNSIWIFTPMMIAVAYYIIMKVLGIFLMVTAFKDKDISSLIEQINKEKSSN